MTQTKTIRQLARKWGAKIYKRSCYRDYAFNGKTIAAYEGEANTKLRSDSNLIHDIAHFVVAAPERRSIPEFGLGQSPDSPVSTMVARGVTAFSAQIEEELASVLGIYWEREMGLDWKEAYCNHNWDGASNYGPPVTAKESDIFDFNAKHNFAERLRTLRERKII